jgi:hypothetical protein
MKAENFLFKTDNDVSTFLLRVLLGVSGNYRTGNRRCASALCQPGCRLRNELALPCRGSLTAIRLSRLPGCQREEKNTRQELCYLNPDPSPSPISELKVLR